MDTTQMSTSKSQPSSRSFIRALALAFNEWLLMLMLYANSIFTYVITRFADYSQLQSPCIMCSRLDHILGRTEHLKKSHWDMFCSKHKSEISSLVYCHAHGKLVDVRGMCETCLLSFDTTNKSNDETYRLLVGKLSEDSSTSPRYCTCCHQQWMPQTGSTDEVLAKPETLTKTGLKQTTTHKKSVRFNDLPHVGYTELKIHSDTEPEDEGVAVKEEDHRIRNVDLETPPAITLTYDLATDKLINLDDGEEVHLIVNEEVPETSEKVLKEEEIISLDHILLASRAMEGSAAVMKEKEDLIRVQDTCTDGSVEVSELIRVKDVCETSEKVLKEEEITSLDHLLLSSRGMECSEVVVKEDEDLIHLHDSSLTSDFKEHLKNALIEETELPCLNDVTSTSAAAETSEDLLKGEILHLQDTSSTPDSKESHAEALMEKAEIVCLNDVTSDASETSEQVLKGIELMPLHETSTNEVPEHPKKALTEETELLCLNDVTSTSVAAETSGDLLMREAILKEKEEEMPHLQDTSLTPDCMESLSEALMEKTETVCFNDVASTSPDAAETPEHVPVNDTSLDEVPESFTTNETPVETSKERDTNQTDMTSLEAEYVVVSPSKSTNSLPEDSTENYNKETKEKSFKASSPESESSSFNSMSVAAETNLDTGESWTQGGGELLDLADAYNNIIVHNESNRGAHIEQWMRKDTSRVSQDLKALLTQISSSSRISPRISCDMQETKNLEYDMQLLIQKRMLERNESTLSLEGVSVSEIEGESEIERLKRQVDHDRKFLTGLYKELEEERSASAVATNQAMAMITRLQEEKALFQMEALQNLRMMEEQAEYDVEAIQRLNELLVEREKVIQDLEGEIDYLRNQKKLDVAENVMQKCFDEERLYITSCLEKIENMVKRDVSGEGNDDNLATEESVSELRERVEKLKEDLYLLEHVVSSLEYGSEGVQFVKEIASHLQSLSMKRHNHTES